MGILYMLNIEYIISCLCAGKTIKQVAADAGVSRTTLYKKLNDNGIKNTQQFKFNHNYFEYINTEEKAYWLGFLMADGCISMTTNPKIDLCLSVIDRDHLVKWHKALSSTKKIIIYNDRACSSHPSKKMCNDLILLGCTSKKSLTLAFPKINNKLIRHFIRGYVDGDGCITFGNKKQKLWQIRLHIIGTKNFLTSIQQSFETNNKLLKIGNNKINYAFEIHGNKKTMKILNWLYEDAEIFLDRKFKLYKEHKNLLESGERHSYL